MLFYFMQGIDIYYSLSYQYVGALGIVYTIVLGIVISLVEGKFKMWAQFPPRECIRLPCYISF